MQLARGVYFVLWAALPVLLWQAAQALGHPLPAWNLPGQPNPVGLFLLWAAVWELMILAPLLELRGPRISWRNEFALWALYTLFGATVSTLFSGWVWAARMLQTLILARFPFLRCLAAPLYMLFFVALIAATWWGIVLLETYGLISAFRRFVRYRLLGLHTDNATLLHLLQSIPLPVPAKATYQRHLESGWVSRGLLEEMLQAAEALPPPQTTAERVAQLHFIQALRNRLEEEEAA